MHSGIPCEFISQYPAPQSMSQIVGILLQYGGTPPLVQMHTCVKSSFVMHVPSHNSQYNLTTGGTSSQSPVRHLHSGTPPYGDIHCNCPLHGGLHFGTHVSNEYLPQLHTS